MENITIDDKIEKCNMISARGNTPNSRKLREIVYTLFNKEKNIINTLFLALGVKRLLMKI